MKTTDLLTVRLLSDKEPNALKPLPHLTSSIRGETSEVVRHILLGSPGAVRQTIHLLHSLHYSETVLWSPIVAVEAPLIIRPEQGDAMSLLRRQV